ncbi:MAG TPA: hypothetical protein VFI96_07255 [Longimicrobiaceae bacterium]|nr:hypothetical protein [Longimicrobiaceae bacterium]
MQKNRLFVALAFAGLVGFAACSSSDDTVPADEVPVVTDTAAPAAAPVVTDTMAPMDSTMVDSVATDSAAM